MKDFAQTTNRPYGAGYYLSLLAVSLLVGGVSLRSGAQSQSSITAPQSAPAAQAPAISVDTKMVTMLVAVRDKHGKLVRDLTKDDFVVEQDGHPQSIAYFSQDSNLPLTVGLLVDTSLSQRRVLDQEQIASGAFLDRMFAAQDGASGASSTAVAKPSPTTGPGANLVSAAPSSHPTPAANPDPPRDQAFLIHFDYEVELLQDLTSSRQKLEAALKDLETPQFSNSNSNGGNSGNGDPSGGGRHRGFGGGTLLYDAIYLASDDVIKTQKGRKALVVLTDGDDRGSKVSLETAIETAQRADAVVYSILFSDRDAQGNAGYGNPHMGGGRGGMGGGRHGGYPQESRPDGKKVLERISRETGGRFFEVTKKQSIEDIYAAIDEELRSQYSIGYKPEPADAGPGYHKIHVAVKPKDLAVQTREGYYAAR